MSLFLSILFGAVGGVYLALGRRNHDAGYLIPGFALLVYPYFVDSAVLITIIGLLISAFPLGRARGWW